jgi:hypothetical protein
LLKLRLFVAKSILSVILAELVVLLDCAIFLDESGEAVWRKQSGEGADHLKWSHPNSRKQLTILSNTLGVTLGLGERQQESRLE